MPMPVTELCCQLISRLNEKLLFWWLSRETVSRAPMPRWCPSIQTEDASTSPTFVDVFTHLDIEVWDPPFAWRGSSHSLMLDKDSSLILSTLSTRYK